MCNETISLTTRSKTYQVIPEPDMNGGSKCKSPMDENPFIPPHTGPLQIEKPISDTILHPLKATIHKAVFNPNARATKNYNIIEDLAQSPCAMSTLDFLQIFPMQ